MQIEYLSPANLTAATNNSRTHSTEQVEQIAASIQEFGFTNPVLIDESHSIIAGHGRCLAAVQLGKTEVPCIVLADLTAVQKRAYLIADNSLALNASWDEDTLKFELEALQKLEFNTDVLGFDPAFLDTLFVPEPADLDTPPEMPAEPGDMNLHHGDCLEVMREIPTGTVDLILTDPPFGMTPRKWDTAIPMAEMWDQSKRVIKPNGAICLFAIEPFASALRTANLSQYKYDWTWIKSRPASFLNAKKQPLRATELITVFYANQPTYNPQMRTGFEPYVKTKPPDHSGVWGVRKGCKDTVSDGERYPVNYLEYPNDNHKSPHPTQKPVPLLEYLIKTYTAPGDTVLDFTMGSGSTGEACMNTGRDFIGIERDPDYFQIASKRLAGATGVLQDAD